MKSPFKYSPDGNFWLAEIPLPTDDTPDSVMTLFVKITDTDKESSLSLISVLLEYGFIDRLQVKRLADGAIKTHLAAEILRGVAEEVVTSRLRPTRRNT